MLWCFHSARRHLLRMYGAYIMRTIKSIEMRAKRDALKNVLIEIESNIVQSINLLTEWIEDEELDAETSQKGLPDDVQ